MSRPPRAQPGPAPRPNLLAGGMGEAVVADALAVADASAVSRGRLGFGRRLAAGMSRTAAGAGCRRLVRAGRAVAAALALLTLAACASEAPVRMADGEPRGGIGGTGLSPLDPSPEGTAAVPGGIGGTDLPVDRFADPGRLAEAALPADTAAGVLGTVTGFGSVLVNGLSVEAEREAVASALGPVTLSGGHVVEIAAVRGPDGRLTARGIAAVFALVGPVTDAPSGEGLTVMGVQVRPEAGAARPAGGLAVGARLAVSGLWQGTALVASRLDPAPAGSADLVVGVAGPEGRRLGGVLLAPGAAPAEPGLHHAATGVWTPEGFRPDRLVAGRPLLARDLDDLSVEAYVTEATAGRSVSGLGAPVDAETRLDRLSPGRAVLIGEWDGAFRVRHGVPLPEGAAARALALGRIGDGIVPRQGAVSTR